MVRFTSDWDADAAGEVVPIWIERNLITGALIDVEELVRAVDTVIRVGSTGHHPVGDGDAPPAQGRRRPR